MTRVTGMTVSGEQHGAGVSFGPTSRVVRPVSIKVIYSLICVGLISSIGVSVAARTNPAAAAQPTHHAEGLPPVPAATIETSLAPPTTVVEMAVDYSPGNDLEVLLSRAGIVKAEATSAARLVHSAGAIAKPTRMTIFLGDRLSDGKWTLEQIRLRPTFETILTVNRRETGDFGLQVERLAVDATPLRFRGKAGTNLYWSLRSAGAPAEAASEYLAALMSRSIRPSDVQAGEQFDLILENRRALNGENEPRELLYAGLNRPSGANVALLRWDQADRVNWVDSTSSTTGTLPSALPVSGRVTSNFGLRAHPILGFRRFHRGVDIGAAWGSPIYASADGWVAHAGWNGGYGIQVRLAHRGARATSYSHMSRAIAIPGRAVRRGDLIGYVGSTGFSTGAHLHYELLVDGQPVNPLSQRLAPASIDPAERAAIAVRLRQLLSVPIA